MTPLMSNLCAFHVQYLGWNGFQVDFCILIYMSYDMKCFTKQRFTVIGLDNLTITYQNVN